MVRAGSAHEIESAVSSAIRSHDLDQALRLIHDFVLVINTEPQCTAQIFGSRHLDALCQQIGLLSLGGGASGVAPRPAKQAESLIVYVVTKIQSSGGHTKVLIDLINAKPDAKHIILSTEIDGPSSVHALEQSLDKPASFSMERAPRSSFADRLSWLQGRLMSLGPNLVYLFNHHQDSIAIAALQPGMNIPGRFYHHGDHHLCLGVYLDHVAHVDFHPMGFHNCRDHLGIRNAYLPLSVADRGMRTGSFMTGGTGLTTCTAARSNKLEVPYPFPYTALIPELLARTGGTHVHIGQLTPWARLKIWKGLKQKGVSPQRFVYHPWVPSVWQALQQHQVDLYVASFPYGGALTLIEAMGAGVPVALHQHIQSPLLGCLDLAYPGAFSWKTPEELFEFADGLTVSALEAQSEMARAQYDKFHRHEHFVARLDTLPDEAWEALPPPLAFARNDSEWALWVARYWSVPRLMFRFAYRSLKRLRSAF